MAAFNAHAPHAKRGIAITPVKFGISFTATLINQAGALVLMYRDGSVQVNHGGTEMGQGLYTKIHQIAARKPGRDAGSDPNHADAHGQGPEHFAHRGVGQHGFERRGGGGRLLADPGAADARCGRMLLDCGETEVRFESGEVYAAGRTGADQFRLAWWKTAYRQRIPLCSRTAITALPKFISTRRPRPASRSTILRTARR